MYSKSPKLIALPLRIVLADWSAEQRHPEAECTGQQSTNHGKGHDGTLGRGWTSKVRRTRVHRAKQLARLIGPKCLLRPQKQLLFKRPREDKGRV